MPPNFNNKLSNALIWVPVMVLLWSQKHPFLAGLIGSILAGCIGVLVWVLT
jgi:hypothetical protein